MKRRIITLVAGIFFALALCTGQAVAKDMTATDFKANAKKVITEISIIEAKAMFDKGDCIFMDCRTPKEYKMGHIPGAINLTRGLIEFKMPTTVTEDKMAKIVVYCKTGGRSCCATKTLGEMGYKKCESMAGGWEAWVAAGYPID